MIDAAESVDFVEELRLRRMAREQYVPPANRDGLHPITLDELSRMDAEGNTPVIHPDDETLLTDQPQPAKSLFGSRIVPLMPAIPGWHGPHEIVPPHILTGIPSETRELHYT